MARCNKGCGRSFRTMEDEEPDSCPFCGYGEREDEPIDDDEGPEPEEGDEPGDWPVQWPPAEPDEEADTCQDE